MIFNRVGRTVKNVSVYYWEFEEQNNATDIFLNGFNDNYNCIRKYVKEDFEYHKTDYILLWEGGHKPHSISKIRKKIIETHNDLNTTIVLDNRYLQPVNDGEIIYSVEIQTLDICKNSPSDRFNSLGLDVIDTDWKRNDKILIIGQYDGL